MESFGARLKREREQRKITLDDIAVSTKIGTRFLLAIEEEHFDQLPGGIFNKGFVRAYARHLGIDEEQAIADYVAASGVSLPEVQPEAAPELAVLAGRVQETGSRSDDIPWGVFAIVLLVVAFGFAIWGFETREKASTSGSIVKVKGSAAATQNVAPDNGPALGTAGQPSQPSPSQAAGSEGNAAPPDAAPSPGTFLVSIKAREDSWLAITADGQQIMEDTLSATAEKSIAARKEIVIKTGNVGGLDISFNGKAVASQGGFNEVKTLTFDPDGLRP